MLKRGEAIISSLKGAASRVVKNNIKFGIRVPQTVNEALRFDKNNGNHLCRYGIAKDIKAVMIAFKILGEGEKPPPTYQEIRCHIIFDIKMEDFQKKAQYVARGHATVAPPTLMYASVVLKESIRISLMLAVLKDLEVKTSDIQNAYLTTPCSEKICTTLGSEFGPDLAGKKALVIRALYGLKYAGDSFINHLTECMINIGYSSFLEDPDYGLRRKHA